jgi:hypothetical protein
LQLVFLPYTAGLTLKERITRAFSYLQPLHERENKRAERIWIDAVSFPLSVLFTFSFSLAPFFLFFFLQKKAIDPRDFGVLHSGGIHAHRLLSLVVDFNVLTPFSVSSVLLGCWSGAADRFVQ